MKEGCRTSREWFSNVPVDFWNVPVDFWPWVAGVLMLAFVGRPAAASEPQVADSYRKEIQPILAKYCYECHADGEKRGNVSFDTFKSDDELVGKRELWYKVLKNTRANIMPPARKPRPTAEPLLAEKYMAAAEKIITAAVPTVDRMGVRGVERVGGSTGRVEAL